MTKKRKLRKKNRKLQARIAALEKELIEASPIIYVYPSKPLDIQNRDSNPSYDTVGDALAALEKRPPHDR